MSQFLTPENFQLAWDKVKQNDGCAGVDGEAIAHFAQQPDRYLAALLKALVFEQYRPLPLRQLFIPKAAGGQRTLGVPTVRDRIVQQALLNVLHPALEPQFEECSFAYRPGRSHLRQRQDVAFQLAIARAIVKGKVLNSKQLLLRLNRKRRVQAVDTAIAGLSADLEAVEAVAELETLRVGDCARQVL